MKRTLVIFVLIVLTLIVLSPLLCAGPVRARHRPVTTHRPPTIYAPPVSYVTTTIVRSPTTTIHFASKTTIPTTTIPLSNYARTNGVKFTGGYFYKGRDHRQWSQRCFSRKWNCWCWFCPSARVWYYWYAPGACYYPISNAVQAAPTPGTDLPPGAGDVREVPVPYQWEG